MFRYKIINGISKAIIHLFVLDNFLFNFILICVLELENRKEAFGRILIIERGECTFIDKARRAQDAWASGIIITDNVPDSSSDDQPMFAMSGDGDDKQKPVTKPVVFLFSKEAAILKKALTENPNLMVSFYLYIYLYL